MTAPEVFCHHQCACCDKVTIVDAKLALPEGWRRMLDRDDDLVSVCGDCQECGPNFT